MHRRTRSYSDAFHRIDLGTSASMDDNQRTPHHRYPKQHPHTTTTTFQFQVSSNSNAKTILITHAHLPYQCHIPPSTSPPPSSLRHFRWWLIVRTTDSEEVKCRRTCAN
ncbi:hypothetical protein BDN72DRAFT_845821, partial [Pluteus cervinus]